MTKRIPGVMSPRQVKTVMARAAAAPKYGEPLGNTLDRWAKSRYLVTLTVAVLAVDSQEAARIAADHHEQKGCTVKVSGVVHNEALGEEGW